MAIFRNKADKIRGVAGSLDGNIVLVADGTSGAGPGIARVFAEAGAAVAIAGSDPASIDVQLHHLGSTPIQAIAVPGHTGTDADRQQLIANAPGPIDSLILNAAHHSLTDTPGMGPLGIVALAKLVATRMQDRGHAGNIVFITGIDRAGPETPAMTLLASEMIELARLLAPNAIRVNAVVPGEIGVNRRGNPLPNRVSPLGHVSVHPVEVGKAAWFLANDQLSGGITGATLKVDRGASLLRPEW